MGTCATFLHHYAQAPAAGVRDELYTKRQALGDGLCEALEA